ncbi:CheR family methyltransferase [Rhodovarius crocodyli]|uniref:CheR family methyltransferase n=1 Tax=Rhodovarius crocodyli TaxID=1979269 RepID=UPI0013E40858|nr:CheR family methyltransferase [Rhodovarius crocodyli]
MLEARLDRAAPLLRQLAPDPSLDDAGWAALLDATTVQETSLFRSPGQLAALEAALPPLLLAARAAGRPFALLSAGCATGEEAYTLAAIAQHAAMLHAPGTAIRVLGLDISRIALNDAETGEIGLRMGQPLAQVPDAYRPWFRGAGEVPRLHPALRDCLAFRRASLTDLPDDLGCFDVALCRNVLIYMTEAAKRTVLEGLARHVLPGGLLALGPTDRAGAPFVPLAHGLYRHG